MKRRVIRRAVYVLSALLIVASPALAQTGGTVRHYHTDAIGSVRAVTDASGHVVAEHDFLPFGAEPTSVPDPAPQRFGGKERDGETGMDYFGARYYQSGSGRFTSVDPSNPVMIAYTASRAGVAEIGGSLLSAYLTNPQQWNRYAYVLNNPVRLVDPFGQEPDGHHLFPNRSGLDHLGRSFTNFVKAGADGIGYPNQPGFNGPHRAYNEAVETVMKGYEKSIGRSRNQWTLSEWRQVANAILNSKVKPIRDFLDLLNKNNGGKAIPALAAAINAYQPSAMLKAALLARGLASLLRVPIIIVNPGLMTPTVTTEWCVGKGCKT